MNQRSFVGYKIDDGVDLYSSLLLSPWILYKETYHRLRLSLDGGIFLEKSGESEKSIGRIRQIKPEIDIWLLPQHTQWKSDVSRLLRTQSRVNRSLIMSHIRFKPNRKNRQRLRMSCIPENIYQIEEWIHDEYKIDKEDVDLVY
jgi:hypothetical protein